MSDKEDSSLHPAVQALIDNANGRQVNPTVKDIWDSTIPRDPDKPLSEAEQRIEDFKEKYGKDLVDAIFDQEELDRKTENQYGDNDLKAAYSILAVNSHLDRGFELMTSDEVMGKIDDLMEVTGKSVKEIEPLLENADLQLSERLDELLEQAQSKGFADKINDEREAAKRDDSKGEGRG